MIPCQKCGYSNPLGTVFCRGCGARVEVNLNMVQSAVKETNANNRDVEIYNWGRSAISLCGFLLICALLLRYVAVPKPPAPEVPAAPDLTLFAADVPWATKAVEAPPVPSAKSLIPDSNRLSWRTQQASPLLSSFSFEFKVLDDGVKALIAAQKPDGSFPGEQPLAATALATLALQAWPRELATRQSAERARSWIANQWKSLSRQSPLSRALAAAALADAEALTDEQRIQQGILLVDGSSPVWQAFLVPLLPADKRPNLVALENKLTTPLWAAYFAAAAGREPASDLKLWFSEEANALKTAEERYLWAQVAWFHPAVPTDLADTLRAWSKAAPAPVSPELEKACGANAKTAMHVLTLTAPARLPILRLSR